MYKAMKKAVKENRLKCVEPDIGFLVVRFDEQKNDPRDETGDVAQHPRPGCPPFPLTTGCGAPRPAADSLPGEAAEAHKPAPPGGAALELHPAVRAKSSCHFSSTTRTKYHYALLITRLYCENPPTARGDCGLRVAVHAHVHFPRAGRESPGTGGRPLQRPRESARCYRRPGTTPAGRPANRSPRPQAASMIGFPITSPCGSMMKTSVLGCTSLRRSRISVPVPPGCCSARLICSRLRSIS